MSSQAGEKASRVEHSLAADRDKALVAMTFDLEMSMHYPTWDQTEWNFRKGDLDEAAKKYALDAARLVKERGGLMHDFLVARVLEQSDVDWLEEIVREGHHLGNHTYDHVHIRATRLDDLQPRFERAPWLIDGKRPSEVIRDNVRLAEMAMETRLSIKPQGFRAPGGFRDGIADREDLQAMLLSLGYTWCSTRYPMHPVTEPGEPPSGKTFQGMLDSQKLAQPFVYPTGLIEVPASPITDVVAFRTFRWSMNAFLRVIQEATEWAIENRTVFDFTSHPSVLCIVDPNFQTLKMICDLVENSRGRAAIVDLGTIALRAEVHEAGQPAQASARTITARQGEEL